MRLVGTWEHRLRGLGVGRFWNLDKSIFKRIDGLGSLNGLACLEYQNFDTLLSQAVSQ